MGTAGEGILFNNFGVLESLPTPPNTGGPWALVYDPNAVPPGWTYQNVGGLTAAKKGE